MKLTNLQKGDLLFQLRSGGELEYAISRVFAGYNGMLLNHVAVYCGEEKVVEATMPQVRCISPEQFLQHSVLDTSGRHCVVHARLLPEYQHLNEKAVEFILEQLDKPYDCHYMSKEKASREKSWYCSELILEAWRFANHGRFVFPQIPMGFRDMETNELLPYWVQHYNKARKPIPEGESGSHPALLSCSEKIDIISVMGQLPSRVNSLINQEPPLQIV
ncbi:YiiX/YebB-like N1pC/P60 family cysteine hydrolase [Endozoicomonas gorgoniicola]|uniref:YiiX/YebB-like N1pC/P60 family cysteine hydrolase n=1 Tax=Endozoicomonas gorgoniicola TaxID=1234144 RepID=A0ABT3N147_9GAMM|nr:YiiX/YebB-like N1pC/P60 family cysteine hydrolase [Endozoicomonas gorgoniicola]MCW7555345.1 YiiX/YebB-like N1pC/P60 family cysteine hydrolase [Endozoicomonas gorgoniicola]